PKIGSPKLEMELERKQIISGLGGTLPLKISNTGNVALYNIDTIIKSQEPLIIGNTKDLKLPRLLPGQTATIWIPAQSKGWFDKADTNITVNINSDGFYKDKTSLSQEYNIEVKPFLASIILPLL